MPMVPDLICSFSRLSITCLVMLSLLADNSSSSLGRVEAAPGLSPPASLEKKYPPHPSPPLASVSPIPLLQPPLPSSTADPWKTPTPAPVIPSVGQTLAAPRPHWHHPEPAAPGESLLHHHFCHTPSLLPLQGPTLMLALTEGVMEGASHLQLPKTSGTHSVCVWHRLWCHTCGARIGRKSCNLSAHVNPGAVGSGHHRLWERQGGGQGQWVQTPSPRAAAGDAHHSAGSSPA